MQKEQSYCSNISNTTIRAARMSKNDYEWLIYDLVFDFRCFLWQSHGLASGIAIHLARLFIKKFKTKSLSTASLLSSTSPTITVTPSARGDEQKLLNKTNFWQTAFENYCTSFRSHSMRISSLLIYNDNLIYMKTARRVLLCNG